MNQLLIYQLTEIILRLSWLMLLMSGATTKKVQVLQKIKVLYYVKGSFTTKRHCHQPVQRHTEQDDEDHTEVGEGAAPG